MDQVDCMRNNIKDENFEACKIAFENIKWESKVLQLKLENYLKDVLKGIAEREKWDLQDLKVSKLDVKDSKFGTLRKYEFRVRIGKTEFVFMMADEISQWKSLHFHYKNESDFESLVKETGSKATLDVVKIQGPFELYTTGDDYLSLTLPLNSSYTGLKKILVGEGITVEVKATAIETAESTSPTPICCNCRIPEGIPVNFLAIGTKIRS